jgi:DNA-binding SARP family transcriptional activator
MELARALYSGNFMDEDLYDDWAATERDNFKEIYLAILDRLSENYIHTERFSSAVALCEDILSKDNCREDIHRRLMFSYYRAGCRDKALRQFKKCIEALKEELEVEPTKLTRQLYEEIKADRLSSPHLL